ncbi:ATP-binding protein [Cytobacillus sp. FJAT-54145]|uniref:histidine kinase n=1 Tax=Cytobacillus spartinae TaxID=3299023 RepID=A0ABW6KCL8_9BACI
MSEKRNRQEEAFRDLVEHSPDAVFIVKNEKILFINKIGISLLGGRIPEDIFSNTLFDFVHPDYHQIAKQSIATVNNGELVDFLEYTFIKLDGENIHVEVRAMPTFFQEQSAQYMILRDITDRKRTREHLIDSEKLSVASQLAAGIHHEVRNPLTTIKGFLRLMEAELPYSDYFKIIEDEVQRIEFVLSELLVLAKPHNVKLKHENLRLLLDDVKAMFNAQASSNNVQIEFIYDFDNVILKCDKNQIKQVFINFLKNAVEAMPDGGMVTVECQPYTDKKVKMLIKDTGTGMPQKILKKIGQPFFTTKESGTGLGVMLSKQIIKNHNGSFNYWSDSNGTIVEIILPISLISLKME